MTLFITHTRALKCNEHRLVNKLILIAHCSTNSPCVRPFNNTYALHLHTRARHKYNQIVIQYIAQQSIRRRAVTIYWAPLWCGAANARVCMHIPSHMSLHTHPLVKVLHVRNNPTATEIFLYIGILAFVSIDLLVFQHIITLIQIVR